MSLEEKKTTIEDVEGGEHSYTCVPFHYDKGMDLKFKILRLIAKPMGDALGDLMKGATEGSEAELVESIDFSRLGDIFEQLPERIIDAGGSKLIAEILSLTVRTTEGDSGPEHLKLKEPLARSKAFAGGNQVESYRAIKWALGVNYAPFGTDGSPDWSRLFKSASAFLPFLSVEQ